MVLDYLSWLCSGVSNLPESECEAAIEDFLEEEKENDGNEGNIQKQKRQKRKKEKEDDIDKQLFNLLSKPTQMKEKSSAELFLLSQVPILEALNPRMQSRAQIRILQVLEDLTEQQEQADRPAPPQNSLLWDQTQRVPYQHWDYYSHCPTPQPRHGQEDIDIIN